MKTKIKKHIFKIELLERGDEIKHNAEIVGDATLIADAIADLIRHETPIRLLILGALGMALDPNEGLTHVHDPEERLKN